MSNKDNQDEVPEEQEEELPVGALRLETNPEGATVYIDNEEKGITPINIINIQPGTYNVVLSYPELEAREIDVEIEESKILLITYDFVTREISEEQEELIEEGKEEPPKKPETELELLEHHFNEMNVILTDKFDAFTAALTKTNDIQEKTNEVMNTLRQYVGKTSNFDPNEKYISTEQLAVSVSTPNKPDSSDVIAPDGPGGTGYDRIPINTIKHDNSRSISIINDGTADLFVITSPDGSSWSEQENPIKVGESRIFHNIWEARIRSPSAGNLIAVTGGVYRVTEYDYSLSYSNITLTTASNKNAMIARTVTAAIVGTQLPNIAVPNEYAVIIKGDPDNTGNLFIADTQANAAAMGGNSAKLEAGAAYIYKITNSNLIWAASADGLQNVIVTVEQ